MTEALKTWRNLTDLRKIAKDHNVVRPNIKQIPELLEELAQLDIAVSEVCESEMEVVEVTEPTTEENQLVTNETVSEEETRTPPEKDTKEPETPCEKVQNVSETPKETVQRLSALVSDLTEKLRTANKDLAKATNDEYNSRAKPKTNAQLLKEQREQDAAARAASDTVDAVAEAQRQFLAGRSQKARENMKNLTAELLKKHG
jgi:hypothetical protein